MAEPARSTLRNLLPYFSVLKITLCPWALGRYDISMKSESATINHATRASELVTIFKYLSEQSNMYLDDAWGKLLGLEKSSSRYYQSLGAISDSLSSLKSEIGASTLRPASKDMYIGAADALLQYVLVHRLRELTTDHLRKETDSFRLLVLLDDVLAPSANRDVPESKLIEWEGVLDALLKSADEAFEDLALREFVVRQLSSLAWAIRNFDFVGIEGVSRAYGAMAAELARSQGMRGARDRQAATWYQRAKKPLLALGVGIAASSAVAEQTDKLITHAGNVFEVITGAEGEDIKTPREKGLRQDNQRDE